MSNLTIVTNRQWRNFVYRADVPADVLASEFDWTDEDESDGFFCYRGEWYHLSQFMCSTNVPGFSGVHTDTYFSGIAVNVSSDGEQYQIARFYS